MPTEPFSREQQIDENSRAVAENRRRLSDHRLDIDDNTWQILNQDGEIQENKNRLEEQKRDIDNNTRNINAQRREIEGAKNVTRNNTIAIEEIRKKTHPDTHDNRNEFDESKHKVDDLEQQGATCASDTLKELQMKVYRLEQQRITDYKREIEDIQSRVNDLEQQDARGYKKLLEELKNKITALDGLHNRVKALEQQSAREYKRKFEELQNRVIALEQQQASNTELQNRVIALEQQQTGNADIGKLQEKMAALEQQFTFTKGFKDTVEELQNRVTAVEQKYIHNKQTDLDSYRQKNNKDAPTEKGNNGLERDERYVAHRSDNNYDEFEELAHRSDNNYDEFDELQASVAVAVKQDTGKSKATKQKSTCDNRNSVKNTENQVKSHDQEQKEGKQKDFEEYLQKDFNQDTSELRKKGLIKCNTEELRRLAADDEVVEKQDIEDTKSDLSGTHIDSTSDCLNDTEECHTKDITLGSCDRNENKGKFPKNLELHDTQEDMNIDTCKTVRQKDKNICENTIKILEQQPGRRCVEELENKIKILESQDYRKDIEELKNRVKVLEQQTGKSKGYTDLQDKNLLPDVTAGSEKYMEVSQNMEASFEQTAGETHSNRSETERRRVLD